MMLIVPTLFDAGLSDAGLPPHSISKKQAEEIFVFFQHHPLFNWKTVHNGCEGKADAVCILLETWGIPTAKAWVFSGAYLRNHIGGLTNNWNYHVAPILQVSEKDRVVTYVLDPATSNSLQLTEDWAANITQLPHSYHCIRLAHWYIFPAKNIDSEKWHSRNKQNRKWMIQCMAGINGLSKTGKAGLCFNKTRIKKIAAAFDKAKKEKPILN